MCVDRISHIYIIQLKWPMCDEKRSDDWFDTIKNLKETQSVFYLVINSISFPKVYKIRETKFYLIASNHMNNNKHVSSCNKPCRFL